MEGGKMEESFEVRVKRLFGSSLFETVPNNSFSTASWSVAPGEVERHQWSRERGGADADADREELPTSEAFAEGGCFAKRMRKNSFGDRRKGDFEADLDDLDEEEEEEEERGEGGDDGDGEEREIRSGVGLDPTLDKEDEEDEYDRAAYGREHAGERVYMRDINNRSYGLSYDAIVSDSMEDSLEEVHFDRYPRADHFAASTRLSEDKKVMENGPSPPTFANLHPHPSCEDKEPTGNSRSKIIEDINLKPILKRKRDDIDVKPKKHVRFDAECKEVHDEVYEEQQGYPTVPQSVDSSESSLLKESPAMPDYIRNPSRYTRYTLDSSDEVNDISNRHAFEDFRNLVKRSDPEELQPEFGMECPKSVTFTPRKKLVDAMSVENSFGVNQEASCMETAKISVCSTGEDHESDASYMEEDHMEDKSVPSKSTISRKVDRKYRSKLPSDDSA